MEETSSSAPEETRRRLIQAIAAGGISTVLAGCSQSGTDSTPATDTTRAETPTTEPGSGSERTTDLETTEQQEQSPEYGACTLGDVELPAGCDGPETYEEDFTEDTTIGADCTRAVVKEFLGMESGVTVTVAPGTRVEFEENAGIYAEEDTALHARGSCEAPILLTGAESTRGHWRGIAYDGSNQPDNVLEHVTIEYGGGPLGFNTWERKVAPSNLLVLNSRVAVDNCTIREAPTYGVSVVEGQTTVESFESNHITENGFAPAYTDPKNAHFFSDGSSYVGNEDDHVRIIRGTLPQEQSVTWQNLDARFLPEDMVDLYGELEIAAGATLSFGEDAWMYVNEPARLRANGLDSETEEVDEILFTAEDERRGHWRGLVFYQANQSENELRNVTFEYGGGRLPDATTRSRAEPANVTAFNSRLSVDDCTMRESANWGISIRGQDTPMTTESFTGNTLTSNSEGAAYVNDNSADVLSANNSFAGNDDDRVFVKEKQGINQDSTWDAIDARYVVDGKIQVDALLTVEPDATLSFTQDSALYMYTGSLNAVGVDENTEERKQITFTAEDELPSFWKGLVFDDSFSSDNVLQNVVVEYGGGELWSATLRQTGEGANVVEVEGSRVVVEGSSVRDSGGHGIWVDDDSELVESGNTFTDNAGQNIGRES
jgi:hypothetical protein